MHLGLIVSIVMHTAILGWAFITIQSQREFRAPEPEPIVTSLVSESDLTRLKQGVRTAKQLQAQAKDTPKADAAKKEAAKPKPVAAAPAPPPPPPEPKSDAVAQKLAVAPPPPPPPAEDEARKREAMLQEQARQAQEKAKAEEQRRAEEQRQADEVRKVEAQRLADEQQRAEEQRRAQEQKQAEERRQAELKRQEEERKQAELQKKLEEERRQALLKKKQEEERKRKEALKKKQDEEKKRQEAEAAKQKQFDADKIAALLNKVPNKSSPAPSAPPTEPTKAKGPALGAPEGRDQQISASELAQLKGIISSRLRGCWRLPSGGGGSDTPVVTLRWRMNPDGTLQSPPEVVERRADALFQIAAEAAQRAVQECAPFPLPADKYGSWRTITWEFDPSQMM